MKYLISELFYELNEMSVKYKEGFNFKKFKKDGCIVIKNFIDISVVKEILESIDWNDSNWSDELKSDSRIYNFSSKRLNEIDEQISPFFKKYISQFSNSSFWMVNKLEFIKNNLGSGGGWHRDSLNRRQLKFMLYLTDVNINNGPFCYVKGSHRVINKFKLEKFNFNKTRYSNIEFSQLGLKEDIITGEKGSLVIFDSSGIHRGKPIIKGKRIALTKYLFDSGIPQNIKRIYDSNV